MATFSAFADEIAPDLKTQMDVCESFNIRCIDVRNIDDTNVSTFTVEKARGYKAQMDDRGFSVPCLGSPIGKIHIGEDLDAHLDLLKHCFEVADAFDCKQIRIFSYYGPEGGDIMACRGEVMDQMARMVKAAEAADMILLHENEANIYGALPDGVKDLFATIKSPSFQGIFDPANFVVEGIKPFDDGWQQGLAELTQFFHIKDKVHGEKACCPAVSCGLAGVAASPPWGWGTTSAVRVLCSQR